MEVIIKCDVQEIADLVKAIQSQPEMSIVDISKYLNLQFQKVFQEVSK